MVTRLFLVYAVLESAVLVALTATIGFGWTLLAVSGSFVVGVALAGSQARRQLGRLRAGGPVTDGVLVALGTLLAVVPGLLTTAAGLLLLVPPTRAALRPLVTAIAVRGIGRRAPLVTAAAGAYRYAGGRARGRGAVIDGDVIDGEVIDVTYDPPAPGRSAD